VTGAAWCDFVSYDPRYPAHLRLFVVRVPRVEIDVLGVREVRPEVSRRSRSGVRGADRAGGGGVMAQNPDELGALWIKQSERGEFMTGTINGQPVVVFRNTRKTGNQPDWRVLKSKPQDGKATSRPGAHAAE
jgi:uncharacterized protein (DUF736 family)